MNRILSYCWTKVPNKKTLTKSEDTEYRICEFNPKPPYKQALESTCLKVVSATFLLVCFFKSKRERLKEMSLVKVYNGYFNRDKCETDQDREFTDFCPLFSDALFLYLSIANFVFDFIFANKPVKLY